jgi:hypothetical protein
MAEESDNASSIPNTTSAGESEPEGPSGAQASVHEPGESIPNTSSAGGTEGAGTESGS